MKIRKPALIALGVGVGLLLTSMSASAFFGPFSWFRDGGWDPWDDYYYGPYGGGPYGWGGYPYYGYGAPYWGGYHPYGGWGAPYYGGYGYPTVPQGATSTGE